MCGGVQPDSGARKHYVSQNETRQRAEDRVRNPQKNDQDRSDDYQ